jgi:hypothetical protein
MKAKTLKPYLVFSTTRDIFFGWASKTGPRMVLTNARRVYYYATHTGIGGPDQLATLGPAKGSKIGPTVATVTVENVANSVVVSGTAVREWEGSAWLK